MGKWEFSPGPSRHQISHSKGWAMPRTVFTRKGSGNRSETFKLITHMKSTKTLRGRGKKIKKMFEDSLERVLLSPSLSPGWGVPALQARVRGGSFNLTFWDI